MKICYNTISSEAQVESSAPPVDTVFPGNDEPANFCHARRLTWECIKFSKYNHIMLYSIQQVLVLPVDYAVLLHVRGY